MEVFVCEVRLIHDFQVESTLVHVASSLEKAKAFCKANPDMEDSSDPLGPPIWWWAICHHIVDAEFDNDLEGVVAFLSSSGDDLESQPF